MWAGCARKSKGRDEEYGEFSKGEGWDGLPRGGQGSGSRGAKQGRRMKRATKRRTRERVKVCLDGCNITYILVAELRRFVRAT